MPEPTLESLRAADGALWDVLEHWTGLRTWQMVAIRDTRVILYDMIKSLRDKEAADNGRDL